MVLILRINSYFWSLININMKRIITLLLLSASVSVTAQPKLITQASITTKTTIVAPDDDEAAPANTSTSGANGEEIRIVRFGGDGETKTTTWLKNELVKTFSESEMGRTTVIRDNNKKLTTTIMEMMGRKTGFYGTDEDQELMSKRMDSMMQSRGQNLQQNNSGKATEINITYVDENKKIAGFDCKKAFILSKRGSGKTDTTTVWYCPNFKLQGLNSTGGSAGSFGGFIAQSGSNGMENLNGFPMQYERTMNRGRKMTVQVTKLIIDKEIADKEFDIPKDIEIKPMKDMQNGGGGPGMQIRIGG